MPVIRAYADDFTLDSYWKSKVDFSMGYSRFVFEEGPTWAQKEVTFQYSLPSGANVLRAIVYATLENIPMNGCSILNANGSFLHAKEGNQYFTILPVSFFKQEGYVPFWNIGSFNVTFNFKANGSLVDILGKTHTLYFKDVHLEIDYEVYLPEEKSRERESESGLYNMPPQSVAIYHEGDHRVLMFDGVLQIQHHFSAKLEEEPDEEEYEKYVNNAINEPDKVVLDVMMSDVYSGTSALTTSPGWDNDDQAEAWGSVWGSPNFLGGETRSGNAVLVLRKIKESREKVSVITPQHVHTGMLISNIVANQREENPFGWSGQIEFQKAYKPGFKKSKSSGSGANSSSEESSGYVPSSSIWAGLNDNSGSKNSESGGKLSGSGIRNKLVTKKGNRNVP